MKTFQLMLAGTIVALAGCAAERHLRDANAADLAGEPIRAERHYRQALEADPDLARDPRFVDRFRQTQARAHHARGRKFAQQNAWRAAIDAYEQAAQTDPTFQLAQDDLQAAGPKASAWSFDRGMTLADRGELDEAIAALQSAVEFDGNNGRARDELAHVLELRRQRRAKAAELYEQSVVLARQKQWQPALAAAASGRDLLPKDPKFTAQISTIKQQAADHNADLGRQQLQANQLYDAELSFNAALGYASNHHAARRGLGDIDFVRGQQAQRAGQLGEALLWFQQANAHLRDHRYDQAIDEVRGELIRRNTVTLALTSEDNAKLGSLINTRLASRKPAYVKLTDPDNSDYQIALTVPRLDVTQTVMSTRQAKHRYYEIEQVRNPRIPELRAALGDAERRLARLQRRHHKQCNVCHGRGHHHQHKDRRCPHCHGSGRQYRVSGADIARAQRKVHQLHETLACEPIYVQRRVPVYHHYTITDYAKTGKLEAVVALIDRRAGEMVDTVVVTRHFISEDSATTDDNPAIGLHADPLQLPDDDHVRERLVDGGAGEITTRVVAMIAKARHEALQSRAQQAGNDKSLLVAAAMMLEPVEPTRAKQLLGGIQFDGAEGVGQ